MIRSLNGRHGGIDRFAERVFAGVAFGLGLLLALPFFVVLMAPFYIGGM